MPRTFKYLYPQIYDLENLWLAWRRARRGGKRPATQPNHLLANKSRTTDHSPPPFPVTPVTQSPCHLVTQSPPHPV